MAIELRGPLPVFPLPGVVLFPGALLPLHVFELRYRTMVRDALSAQRMIALATLRPGWELDYQGSPAFHPLGCVARFERVEWLPNDCYDLHVLGLARVRFAKPAREFPYRACPVTPLEDEPYTADDPLVLSERHAMLELWGRLAGRGLAPQLDAAAPAFDAVVNAVCMGLPVPVEDKLDLLAVDSVLERGRRARALAARAPSPPPRGPSSDN